MASEHRLNCIDIAEMILNDLRDTGKSKNLTKHDPTVRTSDDANKCLKYQYHIISYQRRKTCLRTLIT